LVPEIGPWCRPDAAPGFHQDLVFEPHATHNRIIIHLVEHTARRRELLEQIWTESEAGRKARGDQRHAMGCRQPLLSAGRFVAGLHAARLRIRSRKMLDGKS
jgi:hypothetical protein